MPVITTSKFLPSDQANPKPARGVNWVGNPIKDGEDYYGNPVQHDQNRSNSSEPPILDVTPISDVTLHSDRSLRSNHASTSENTSRTHRGKRKHAWSAEKRAAWSERMKQYWAQRKANQEQAGTP